MPTPEKPRHRSGYGPEELEQVRAACLTVAVTLGAYLDNVCIVGGLVPSLLIDASRTDEEDDDGERHPGTNDLDVGLALALLDDERYAEISARLRAEGFGPDINDSGNPTVQRWRLGELKVTVDFLIPPAPDQATTLRVQNLQSDFGALITPGLELASTSACWSNSTATHSRVSAHDPGLRSSGVRCPQGAGFRPSRRAQGCLRPRLRGPPHPWSWSCDR